MASTHGRLLLERSQRFSSNGPRADSVELFLPVFLARYPNWQSLAEAGPELAMVLQPLGLQVRKARTLTQLAQSMLRAPGVVDEERPGVGQYISRALAVSHRNAPVAMVDANFVRIVRRAFSGPWRSDYRYDPRLQAIAASVVSGGDSRRVNWAVMDLGALICKPRRPLCARCPVWEHCATGQVAVG